MVTSKVCALAIQLLEFFERLHSRSRLAARGRCHVYALGCPWDESTIVSKIDQIGLEVKGDLIHIAYLTHLHPHMRRE